LSDPEFKIDKERIVLINSEKDLEIIKKQVGYPDDGRAFLKWLGYTAINIKAPDAKAKEPTLNTMPFVFARAIAGIFKDKESVRKPYQALVKSYGDSGLISGEALANLEDLDNLALQLVDIPLIIATEQLGKAVDAQIIYEEETKPRI